MTKNITSEQVELEIDAGFDPLTKALEWSMLYEAAKKAHRDEVAKLNAEISTLDAENLRLSAALDKARCR